MPNPDRKSVRRRNCGAVGCRTALAGGEIEPRAPKAAGSLHVVETEVNIAFDVVPVFCGDVGTGASQITDCQLPETEIQVLNARAITAHVQRIEVIDVDMLATVISFPGPELRIRLELQNVAGTYEGFPQPELIIAVVVRKICVTRGIRRICFDHGFRFQPRSVAVMFRVQPIVDENQFPICLRFVAQPVFRVRTRRLKRHLLAALAVHSVARPKISVKFKRAYLLLKLRDSRLRLVQQVISRF